MAEPEYVSGMPSDAGIVSISMPAPNRCFMELAAPSGLVPAVSYLTELHGARLMTITCLEVPAFFEILHHLDVAGTVVTLRSKAWKPSNAFPSVAGANPAAELIEHEAMELFGIVFEGNPRPSNMVLTEDRAKLTPLRQKASQLDTRIDGNMASIIENGSTTAPSKRVMKVRTGMGMPEGPPMCPMKCQPSDIVFRIADETGATSRHPGLRKGATK